MNAAPHPGSGPQGPSRPLVIGLLGGVAAGKSTVAGILAEHGFEVLDADALARAAVEREDVARRIRERFGAGVLDAEGRIDRGRLAEIVFADPNARADLEAIVHPVVRRGLEDRLAAARSAGRSVVLDVPLLLESGLAERCDALWFVDADQETRRRRARVRGWSEGELERREAHQKALSVKRNRADATIHNDRSIQDTRRQVAEVLARLGASR